MKIENEEKKIVEISLLLKKARIKAQELDCECDSDYGFTCGKHKIVDDILNAESNINKILSNY